MTRRLSFFATGQQSCFRGKLARALQLGNSISEDPGTATLTDVRTAAAPCRAVFSLSDLPVLTQEAQSESTDSGASLQESSSNSNNNGWGTAQEKDHLDAGSRLGLSALIADADAHDVAAAIVDECVALLRECAGFIDAIKTEESPHPVQALPVGEVKHVKVRVVLQANMIV
jgi:hypothetical protein